MNSKNFMNFKKGELKKCMNFQKLFSNSKNVHEFNILCKFEKCSRIRKTVHRIQKVHVIMKRKIEKGKKTEKPRPEDSRKISIMFQKLPKTRPGQRKTDWKLPKTATVGAYMGQSIGNSRGCYEPLLKYSLHKQM